MDQAVLLRSLNNIDFIGKTTISRREIGGRFFVDNTEVQNWIDWVCLSEQIKENNNTIRNKRIVNEGPKWYNQKNVKAGRSEF